MLSYKPARSSISRKDGCVISVLEQLNCFSGVIYKKYAYTNNLALCILSMPVKDYQKNLKFFNFAKVWKICVESKVSNIFKIF